jgi:hypothetical protein
LTRLNATAGAYFIFGAGPHQNNTSEWEKRPIMPNILHLGAIVVCLLAPTAFAQDDPLPPNTVPCEAFKKNASGDWVAQADVVFNAAGLSEAMKGDTIINPGNYDYSGLNMYQLLERKCSAHS